MAKKKKTTKAAKKTTAAKKKTTRKVTKKTSKKTSKKSTKAASKKKASKAVTKKKTTKKTAAAATKAEPAKVVRRQAPVKVSAPKPEPVRELKRGEDVLNDVYLDPLTDKELSRIKSDLTRKDLEYFFKLLLERRAEVLGDVESLKNDALNTSGNLSNMPLHMADVGSDNYEQEFTLGLLESERRMVREIDEALMRIKNKSYGVCILSGKPIARERLEAKPWAKYTIEIAREMEKRGLTR